MLVQVAVNPPRDAAWQLAAAFLLAFPFLLVPVTDTDDTDNKFALPATKHTVERKTEKRREEKSDLRVKN